MNAWYVECKVLVYDFRSERGDSDRRRDGFVEFSIDILECDGRFGWTLRDIVENL